MTTYYLSPNGSDANNGLGPDASAVTNKPWLTLAKALNTGTAISNATANSLYVAPGYFYSTGTVPVSTVSSAANPLQIIGDPLNAQGFKDGSGVLLAPGLPWITTRTSGEGLHSPIASTTVLIDGSTNNPSGIQLRFLVLEANAASTTGVIYRCSANAGTDLVIEDCYISAYAALSMATGAAPTASRNHTIRRCVFIGSQVLRFVGTTAAATADADVNITVEENLLFGNISGAGDPMSLGSSAGNKAGGVRVYHNIALCAVFFQTVASQVSTVTPCRVAGNIFMNPTNAALLNSATSGHIIDDGFNVCNSVTQSFTNVTKAGTTIFQPALNLVLPHLFKWGLELPRPDFLGWTDAAHANQKFSALGRTTSDIRGRTARPWGAGDSIGCWQVADIVQDTASSITGGGTNSMKLTGKGEWSFFLTVEAVSTTITIKTKSTSYGGTNYPQVILEANPTIGVTTATATATDATEQTLTIGPFTPSAAGVIEIRLVSRSSSTTSLTYFDTLTRT